MTEPRQATYHYSIDEDDLIVSVSNTWLSFAQENEASELTEANVLGRSLWSFVEGPKVRELYEMLLGWVRSQDAQISVPFRCDSPDVRRFMRPYLSPSENAGFDMAGILERAQPRKHLQLLDRLIERADYSFETCSLCRRVFAFGAWLQPEQAVARLGWLESEQPPRLTQGVCPECERTCRDQVRATSGASAPDPRR